MLEPDDDDYFIEDVLKNRNKKKKVDGKKKGGRVERELAKLLIGRFGEGFSRSIGSGNRTSQVFLPKHALDIFSGDLVVPAGFKYAIECKGGYDDIDLNNVFNGHCKGLDKFLDQVTKDSDNCGRKPLLMWKRTRKPWIAFVHNTDLVGYKFPNYLIYGKWTGLSLEELLKLEDDFFKEPHE